MMPTENCCTNLNIITKKKMKNKRRFSDEQIRLLETMFESETKIEPRKKVQIARDLGLQPRQVATWFQNKRARGKSKQLERDYSILLANYNSLVSRFEILKKEKQSLLMQLQKLDEMVGKTEKEIHCEKQEMAGNTDTTTLDVESDANGKNTKMSEFEAMNPSLSLEKSDHLVGGDDSMRADYFGLNDETDQLLNIAEPADSSLTSPEDWVSLDSDDLMNQSTSSCQWLDFWS